jgi:hypothetical protein
MGEIVPAVNIILCPDGIRDGEYNHADYERHDDIIQFSLFATNLRLHLFSLRLRHPNWWI